MAAAVRPAGGLTLADVFGSLSRHRVGLAIVTIAITAATVAVLLLLPPTYTAGVSVIPESRGGMNTGQLAGLAALAGISLDAGSSGSLAQSPQFYATLLGSRPILYAVLQRRYPTPAVADRAAPGDSASLTEILRAPGETPERRLWNGARMLKGRTKVQTDIKTGIITLTMKHRSPSLASAVASAFVQEVEQFNRHARQSQAGERRRFIEDRLVNASQDLEAAESDLRAFLTRNREYENSPSLRFEFGRLDRALMVQRELYLGLRRELDAARIAEVDDVPTITVVEPAVVPQRRSSPARRNWLVAVVALSLALQTAWLVLLDHHDRLAPGLAPALAAFSPGLARRIGRERS